MAGFSAFCSLFPLGFGLFSAVNQGEDIPRFETFLSLISVILTGVREVFLVQQCSLWRDYSGFKRVSPKG